MIQINQNRCTGCGLCVSDCATGKLRLEKGCAYIGAEDYCIKCGHCIAICPQAAVSITDYDMNEVLPYNREDFSLDADHFLNFIKFRRSTRKFTAQPVEKEKLLKIIEAGRFTATGSNSQTVRYIVVQADKMAQLKALLWEGLRAFGEETGNRGVLERYTNYKNGTESKDTLFFGANCAIFTLSPSTLDAGLASTNMEMMGYLLGLGVLYCGWAVRGLLDNPQAQAFLGIDRPNQIASCLLYGYPDIRFLRTVPRKAPDITFI